MNMYAVEFSLNMRQLNRMLCCKICVYLIVALFPFLQIRGYLVIRLWLGMALQNSTCMKLNNTN